MHIKMLIVEDEPGTQLTLRRLFMRIDPDTRIVTASSAEEAFRLLKDASLSQSYFDLAVVDLGLPGSNGLVLWELMTKQFPEVDTLFVSGTTYEDWFRRIASKPVWPPFIRKPVTETDLRRFWEAKYPPMGEFAG